MEATKVNRIIAKRNNHFYDVEIKDDGTISFTQHGGGFVYKVSKEKFDADFEIVDGIPNELIACWIGIDGSKPIRAICNPHASWNGWAMPLFRKEDCDHVIQTYFDSGDSIDDYISAKKGNGGYHITCHEDEECNHFSKDKTIEFCGEEIVVNDLTDGWCWSILPPEHVAEYFFRAEIAKLLPMSVRNEIDSENRINKDKPDALLEHSEINVNAIMDKAFGIAFGVDDHTLSDITPDDSSANSEQRKAAFEIAREYGYSYI